MFVVKPDVDIFARAVSTLSCEPDEVLFIDDNQQNVDGARAVGLHAAHAMGVDETRSILVSHGVL